MTTREITMKNEKLTLIVPVYNEQKTLDLFYNETERILKDIDIMIEYLFIDDGSKDNSLKIIHKLADTDKRIHYISFSRNFGKEAAIYAGLKNAAGDYITILDADLQDPPSLIPKMLHSVIEEGYDCVGTRRVNRKGEPPIRSFFARIFYKLINKISKTEIVDGARATASNGWNMRILSARQEKQNGHFGNYFYMQLMELLHFQLCHLYYHLFWESYFV